MQDNPKQVFSHPDVEEELERRLKIMTTKADVDAEYVLKHLINIVEADMGSLLSFNPDTGQLEYDWENFSPEQKKVVQEFTTESYQKGRGDNAVPVVKTRLRTMDKLKALEMIAKYLGMFKERIEVEGELGIADRIMRNRQRMRNQEPEQEE